MPREFSLRVSCADIDDSRLLSLTQDLTKSLREQNLGTIHAPKQPSQAGEKGDPISIGNIVLALISSGGVAVSLVQVLKTYAERKRSIHFEITRSDGGKLALSGENLRHEELRETSLAVEKFLKS
jgi:hypothetical protein